MRAADLLRLAAVGLRERPLRTLLSAIGLALGIAAMTAMVGIAASSRAQLDQELARLGTNLLTVTPAGDAKLPPESLPMIRRIASVTETSGVGRINTGVYRSDTVPSGQTGGLAVLAAEPSLLNTVSATVHAGRWLDRGSTLPTVVLGARAGRQLDLPGPGYRVWIGGMWFGVMGILDPVALAPELDGAALIDWGAAQRFLRFDGSPTALYTRSLDSQVSHVRDLLGRTAFPASPDQVRVSRPSDALRAREATDETLGTLIAGLGALALLIGGIGVANTMVIVVLERRSEIGLRRALGATRGHIRAQFLVESLLLSVLGGAGGVLSGLLVTTVYAGHHHWPTTIPLWIVVGGIGATTLIGTLAGLYPAMRAARVTPTQALSGAIL